jgi:protein-tyrosine phosphatase
LIDKLKKVFRVTQEEPEESVSWEAASHRVLLVCMGNICRSPTAEGVLRRALKEHAPELAVYIDSAGTHAYHVGHPPDPRACRAAERRGVDITRLRARKIEEEDFERFDIILAMDRLNVATLMEQGDPRFHERIKLLMEFAGGDIDHSEVPDPYYGGASGFEQVLDLIEIASLGLIEHLRQSR